MSALEVKPFGIDVIVVEPGGVASEWGNIAADNLVKASGKGAYAKEAVRTAEATKKTYAGNVTKPEVIAKCIGKAVTARKPKTRYLIGMGAKPMVYMKNILGDRLYDKIVLKFMQ